jgi:hypothetical protein
MPANGSILLGDVAQHLTSVEIACNFCTRVGKANVARLLSEHGPDMPIPTLLRLMSTDCPRGLAKRSPSRAGFIYPAWPACLHRMGQQHDDRHKPIAPQAPETRTADRDQGAESRLHYAKRARVADKAT